MALDIKPGDIRAGDLLRLKKPHPCGGNLWKVNRVGGDIGLFCQTCGHYIMVPRFRMERRIREITRPTGGVAGNSEPPAP